MASEANKKSDYDHHNNEKTNKTKHNKILSVLWKDHVTSPLYELQKYNNANV